MYPREIYPSNHILNKTQHIPQSQQLLGYNLLNNLGSQSTADSHLKDVYIKQLEEKVRELLRDHETRHNDTFIK